MHAKRFLLLIVAITSIIAPLGMYCSGYIYSDKVIAQTSSVNQEKVENSFNTFNTDPRLIKFSEAVFRIRFDSTLNFTREDLSLWIISRSSTTSPTICLDTANIYYQLYLNELLWLLMWPALIAAIGIFVDIKHKKENGSIREMVYRAIELNPGIHFRKLCRELNRKTGVVQYHLQVLELKENRIRSHQDGEKYTRYFPSHSQLAELANRNYYNLVSMLHRPSMRTIIELLRVSEDGLSRSTLATEIGISLQGVTCNCKKLSACDIIEETRVNRQKFYKLTDETIRTLEVLDSIDRN
ncbi:MAG: winged helix-turn-helix transcriptional regulator [Promethearchaeota archaeon]